MKNDLDKFNVLREIGKKPESSQRDLSQSLGLSLGKINYCIKALRAKGLIKMNNFKKNKNKLGYAYLLTPKGIVAKTKLTLNGWVYLQAFTASSIKTELMIQNGNCLQSIITMNTL